MKYSFVTLGILFGSAALAAGSANAQNYPWCAQYGGRSGGGENCGFSTHEQCMAALSGNGGFCNRNTQYTGGNGGSGSVYRRRHRHYHND